MADGPNQVADAHLAVAQKIEKTKPRSVGERAKDDWGAIHIRKGEYIIKRKGPSNGEGPSAFGRRPDWLPVVDAIRTV